MEEGIGLEEDVIGKNLDEDEEWETTEGEKEADSKWAPFGREYTKEEQSLILSKVIMVAIETAFNPVSRNLFSSQ